MENKIERIILSAALILLFSAVISSAYTFSTTNYVNEVAENYGVTKTGYYVTYDIKRAGWYLLPALSSLATISDGGYEPEDYADYFKNIYYADSYKYTFSPFTKKYIKCTRFPNINPLYCPEEEIYNLPDKDIQEGWNSEEFMNDYFAYTAISADWHYYTKPVKVIYTYWPGRFYDIKNTGTSTTINENTGESKTTDVYQIGFFGAKLKSGWNIISFPSYAAFGDITIGECNILRIYGWDDENQNWINLIENSREELVEKLTSGRDDYSGMGMAIKVSEDCTFLKKIGDIPGKNAPPALPNN